MLIVVGIGSGQASIERCIELARRPQVLQAWRKCRHLVIDEVSMVDGLFFEVRFLVQSCLLATYVICSTLHFSFLYQVSRANNTDTAVRELFLHIGFRGRKEYFVFSLLLTDVCSLVVCKLLHDYLFFIKYKVLS